MWLIINPLPNGGDPALVGAGPFSYKMQALQHRLGNGKIPIVPPEVANLFVTGFAGSLDHIIVPDRCKTPSGAPGSANRGGHCGQSSSRQCSHEFGLLAARADIRAERNCSG